MGNRCCLAERARVTAWDADDNDWGLPPAERSGISSRARGGVASSAENGGGGMRVKIRMTKGQLRRLMEKSAGRRGASDDEDVVAEIMSMGTVRVHVAELRHKAERHRGRPAKLETIQEEDDYIDE